MKNANSSHAGHVEVVEGKLKALHEMGREGKIAIAYLIGGPVGAANNRPIIKVLQENRLVGPNKKIFPDVTQVAARLYGDEVLVHGAHASAQKPRPVSSRKRASSLVCG